jgi:alcohol dehydrogenase
MIADFRFAATPHIHFGAGRRDALAGILRGYGPRVLLVTGSVSFDASPLCRDLLAVLSAEFELQRLRVDGEPSPSLVDESVAAWRGFAPDAVVAIGGGSAVDAGKAIAGLLPLGHSVLDYLEGRGRGRPYTGPATPFIALPTTAGTGGETSKNAVLSVIGEGGYKKSFRHEMLVARHVILDPELTLSCPPALTAACGMDALTQLLESYVSSRANPISDALAASGMAMVRAHLLRAVRHGDDIDARAGMLYASSISGLTLANAGLGAVHGLASPLGAFFPIPHGTACGTLVHEATRLNVRCMREREPRNPALIKYAEAGRILTGGPDQDDAAAIRALLDLLDDWTDRLAMPRLSFYGVSEADIPRIVAGSRGNSMQTNPIRLQDLELSALLADRL